MKSSLQPHDRFFKSIIGDVEVARDFFQRYLPSTVLDKVDLDSMHYQDTSFIEQHLKMQCADVLYSVSCKDQPGYLYLLIEHQSTPDYLMPFRLLKYMVSIIQRHVYRAIDKTLPVVYPMVVYTGAKTYNYSMDLFDLFGPDGDFMRKVFFGPYELLNIGDIADETLQNNLRAGLMLRVMKNIYAENVTPFLRDMLKELRELEKLGENAYINTILTYLVEAGEVENEKEFTEIIQHELSDKSGEYIMTIAEKFKRRGKEEGRVEGRVEGREEGEAEATRTIARRLIRQGMALEDIANVTHLSIDDLEKMRTD